MTRNILFLTFLISDAGSAGFSETVQLTGEVGWLVGEDSSAMHVFVLCDWKTAWSLLFHPIVPEEKEKIKNQLKVSFLVSTINHFHKN